MSKKQSTLFPKTPGTSSTLNILRDLDRSEVEPLAFKIISVIGPYCTRAEVAGSIRRHKPTINDIDIVVLPKPHSWVQIIKEVRFSFDAVTEKQGDKLATLYLPFASEQGLGHIQVDLYRATKYTWGILLLVRTGSAEHNVHLCNLALRKGLRLQYSQGLIDSKDNVIAGRTEEEVFEALGLPFIIPQDRDVVK